MDRCTEAASTGGLEATFRVSEWHLLGDIGAFGVGAIIAAGPGGDLTAGAVTHLGSGRSELPHWVVVHTDADGLRLFAADRRGSRGQKLVRASPQTFRASLHRNLGQFRLVLFIPEWPSIALRGRSWPGSRALQVARAVVEMAKPA